jgi:hypothetical protein
MSPVWRSLSCLSLGLKVMTIAKSPLRANNLRFARVMNEFALHVVPRVRMRLVENLIGEEN